MKHIRLAVAIFLLLLLTVFFHYIYVCSVRNQMMRQIEEAVRDFSDTPSPDESIKLWKNRKGLLSLAVPLTVLDQIDMQLSLMDTCADTKDANGYLYAAVRLRELLRSLGR